MKQIRSLTVDSKRDEFILESESGDSISELDVKQGAKPVDDEDRGYLLIAKPKTKSSPGEVIISNLYNQPDQRLSFGVDGRNYKVIIFFFSLMKNEITSSNSSSYL